MPSEHRFGGLLTHYRARKPSLSQKKLAELTGFDNAILVRMSQGKKDLTGPSGRDRIIRILGTLLEEGIALTLDEANALLASADLPPLYAGLPAEAALIRRLGNATVKVTEIGENIRLTNLLPELTSFIGRSAEIVHLKGLLRQARLVTLTGAGGIGKTRLAIEAASAVLAHHEAGRDFHDGIWIVEFAQLADPLLVPQTVASTLNLREQAGRSFLDLLVGHLSIRNVLLILDNCEHLVTACAELAEYLLQRCPQLTILATSRELLRIPGEILYQVGPLETPPLDCKDIAVILNYPAIQLFVTRMALNVTMAGNSKLTNPTPSQILAILHICYRLDGMPLALELAAALTRTLTPEEISTRLEDRFALLTNGHRTAIPRHRTLRDAIDWSYSLLSIQEKQLFACLSIFAGGWMTDAAEAICAHETASSIPKISRQNVLAVLGELANKSLVVVEHHATHTRYRMLETIREYALGRFSEIDRAEQITLHQRHLDFLIQLINRPWPEAPVERAAWLERLNKERDNFRLALGWALQQGQVIMAQQLIVPLAEYWRLTSQVFESYEQLHKILAKTNPNERTSLRASLLIYTGIARWLFEEEAIPMLQEALEIATELNDTGTMINALARLGNEAYCRRDHESERVYYERAYEIIEKTGDRRGMASGKELLGDNCVDTGRLDTARKLYEEALAIYAELNVENHGGWPLKGLGQITFLEGDPEKALLLFKDALNHVIASGIGFGLPLCVSRIAAVAAARKDFLAAARLFGIEDSIWQLQQTHLHTMREPQEDQEREDVRTALDSLSFKEAYKSGQAMSFEQGIAFALAL